MRVLIKMIYTVGVEDGGAANDAMHLICLLYTSKAELVLGEFRKNQMKQVA